jgi:hypothetical protein
LVILPPHQTAAAVGYQANLLRAVLYLHLTRKFTSLKVLLPLKWPLQSFLSLEQLSYLFPRAGTAAAGIDYRLIDRHDFGIFT